MSGENKKQDILLSCLTWILTLALNLGAYTVGVLFRSRIPAAGVLYRICAVLLLLATFISWLVGSCYAKTFNNLSVRDTNDLADARKARMTRDSGREWCRLRRICVFTLVYFWTLFLLCLAVPFFYGASTEGSALLVLDIFSAFFLSGLVGCVVKRRSRFQTEGILPEEEYPLLYGMIRQEAGKLLGGKHLHIRVMHGIPNEECTACVHLENDHVTLLFGTTLLCVADQEELHQVVRHELAHLGGKEIQQERIYRRAAGCLYSEGRSIFSMLSQWALTLPAVILSLEGELYFTLVSRETEARADDRAASRGQREKQASVLAKINAYSLYTFEQEPFANVFQSEEIPQHLMTERAIAFREALVSREADWRRLLQQEIPSRIASHPTFRQRWEALGCCAYSLAPADRDTDFARECWAAAETADAQRATISREKYAELRKEGYLDELAIIEEYESRDWDLTPDELRPPMLAYFRVGMPEKMEALCDKVIAENESLFATAFARYWKGALLLYRYDNTGLQWLYEAMELNTNYIEEGLNCIGSYCTRMGLQEELEEYRRRAPDFLQTKVDRSHGGITNRANLAQDSLPEGWLDRIRDFIVSVGGDCLEEIYLVKEIAQESYSPSSFVLRFRQDADPQLCEEIYDKVFRLLDDWPEDWEFCLYTYEDSMAKPLGRVEGSCIWKK